MTRLVGREAELRAVHRLVAGIGDGGASLIVRGDAGVGKSMLLEAVAADVTRRGWRVLRTDGTPPERRLPLAGLHKLLRPVLPDAAKLPSAQQEVLLTALGLVGGPPSPVHLVGLATLDLLSEVAGDAPVLVLVDDAHWLDEPTAEVLGFMGRRLGDDPVLLLASARRVDDDPLLRHRLPELELSGLESDAAGLLLDQVAPELAPRQRRLVLESASGNPLALVELPRTIAAADGRLRDPAEVPMTARLERTFASRLSDLPPDSRDFVLLAALNDSDRVEEAIDALGVLRGAPAADAHRPATAAGLLQLEAGAVRFRHPLVRSAIWQGATPAERQAAHAALGATLAADPDRAAWHVAAAVVGADEVAATGLDELAARARARGALGAALDASRRAAELSADASRRGQRLLLAFELAFETGNAELGTRLDAALSGHDLEPLDAIRLEWLREARRDRLVDGVAQVESLIAHAVRAAAEADEDLALELVRRAALRCFMAGLGSASSSAVVAATGRLRSASSDPRLALILAYASPLQDAAQVAALIDELSPAAGADPDDLLVLAQAAACIGAFERALGLCAASARGLREQGRLTKLAEVLRLLAGSALRRSAWTLAAEAAHEAITLAAETRQPMMEADAHAFLASALALRGRLDDAEAACDRGEPLALATRNHFTLSLIQDARAAIADGRGDPVGAFEHLLCLYRPDHPAHHLMRGCWSLGNLAEYAVAAGREDEAREQLRRLAPLAEASESGIHMAVRQARAALAEPPDVEARHLHALEPDLEDWPFERARVRLGYGAWLRRARRLPEAREQLRQALSTFEELHATIWADRAERELRVSGEHAPRRAPDLWFELTPQEAQIAQLVAEGLSNKQIARRLFLSHRTVASHLYRMFPKLGVASRTELARVAGDHGVGRVGGVEPGVPG